MDVTEATHDLRCAHQIGRSRTEYTMPCILLKDMGDGRAKIRVFGNRYWSGKEHRSRIRYVWKWRLRERR